MKKILGVVAAGSLAAMTIKQGVQYLNKLNQTKKNVTDIGQLIDSFVQAYYDSDDYDEAFTKVIREKLTIDQLRHLQRLFTERYDRLRYTPGSTGYYNLLTIINEQLPVEGSVVTLTYPESQPG